MDNEKDQLLMWEIASCVMLQYKSANQERGQFWQEIATNQISRFFIKGTVMINYRLRVLKVSWKFRISTIFNFGAIHSWNLLFS